MLLLDGQVEARSLVAGSQRDRPDLVDDVREHGDDVAIGEREHRVEVHGRAQLGHGGNDYALGRLVVEQGLGHLQDAGTRTALAQSHQHHALARHQHVAAFKRGEAMMGRRVAPPHREAGLGEVRMELVDGRGEDGLLVARRPVKGIQRDALVDPAGGVARVEHVGQRRQQVAGGLRGGTQRAQDGAGKRVRHFGDGKAADQRLRQLPGRQALEVRAHVGHDVEADLVRVDLVVEDPLARRGQRHGLRQHLVHLHDIHAALAHLVDEVEVVALGVVDPHHVVEQQVVLVAGRQPRVREAGRADQHLAQHADFRMDSVGS